MHNLFDGFYVLIIHVFTYIINTYCVYDVVRMTVNNVHLVNLYDFANRHKTNVWGSLSLPCIHSNYSIYFKYIRTVDIELTRQYIYIGESGAKWPSPKKCRKKIFFLQFITDKYILLYNNQFVGFGK